jgi:hypothetical protein
MQKLKKGCVRGFLTVMRNNSSQASPGKRILALWLNAWIEMANLGLQTPAGLGAL